MDEKRDLSGAVNGDDHNNHQSPQDTSGLGLDTYTCPRCEKSLPASEQTEHEDWHLAMDLQSQEQQQNGAPPSSRHPAAQTTKTDGQSQFQPPSGPPPQQQQQQNRSQDYANQAPQYAPPSHPPPVQGAKRSNVQRARHTNKVIEAANVRARDEQDMQQLLQNLQFQYKIYNPEIEPEHETDYYCGCPIHNYQRMKWARYPVQDMWSKAVMYPGEKSYTDNPYSMGLFSGNPYRLRVVSPYGYVQNSWRWGPPRPSAGYHSQSIHQTIDLNNRLNKEAQAAIDAREPKVNIWDENMLEAAISNLDISDEKKLSIRGSVSGAPPTTPASTNGNPDKKTSLLRRKSQAPSTNDDSRRPSVTTQKSSFRKALGIKSSDERSLSKATKVATSGGDLRDSIVAEETGRWPDEQWRWLVTSYQDKVGMTEMIAKLRERKPLQYLHLLRAGYFEPIPVAWADQASNPLKFSIESASGWRGITPAWRGYEDTAEERLYWVLNHRIGSVGMRMKPDFISEMNMARDRMARAVEPPPQYFDATDTCHVQHTSEGYSKQVMPPPFVAYDRPEDPTDDTMILLDVSGSMDFDPVRPIYDRYLITGYAASTQPKNKLVAKAIIRRFTDAMQNHDHAGSGYDLTVFSSHASYIGTVNHHNLDQMWRQIRIGGGTRVMTGWQKVKELHFRKHSESATHHPIYGWQAGPQTPILRLLLLLDGEATDMDEFELDLLGCSWAHVTIFLIGVDGCPHHHRHANELQRISDVNHHVSFVDAQGNMPERYVTHELLKRHLGYEVSYDEFQTMEELPTYDAATGR